VSQLHKAYVGLTVAAENEIRILCSWREVSRRLGGVKFKAIFGDWPTADDRVPTEMEKPPRPELVSWIMGNKAKHAARLRRRNVVDIRQVAVKLGGEASGPKAF
jgi:hypothetical protein